MQLDSNSIQLNYCTIILAICGKRHEGVNRNLISDDGERKSPRIVDGKPMDFRPWMAYIKLDYTDPNKPKTRYGKYNYNRTS